MLTITVSVQEKRSTQSQFENQTIGATIQASNLEIQSSPEILAKSAELFALARKAVDEQLTPQARKEPENGHEGGNGNGGGPPPSSGGNGHSNGNGSGRRAYGRPSPEPSEKQKGLLATLIRRRRLPPETVRQICERVAGCRLEQLDRKGFSLLLQNLMNEEVAK